MKFARVIFLSAGIYGLLALLPQYFLEDYNGRNYPPPITHPEYYYGFIGVAVAWQVVFLIMARDPLRFRPLMLPAVLEKLSFGVVAVILYLQQRLSTALFGAGLIDLTLAVLFVAAYVKTADGRTTEQA
ncbi:MAG TPA: hypothetical protein VGX24_02345 [Pyrinomonadaceae bacterium]|jgi:hypothetical protein|nr:hypothetical protein [Pyrinomonadaceae bacterium]